MGLGSCCPIFLGKGEEEDREKIMGEHLSETLQVRITPGMDHALRVQARRLKVRVADLVRVSLAITLDDIHGRERAVIEPGEKTSLGR